MLVERGRSKAKATRCRSGPAMLPPYRTGSSKAKVLACGCASSQLQLTSCSGELASLGEGRSCAAPSSTLVARRSHGRDATSPIASINSNGAQESSQVAPPHGNMQRCCLQAPVKPASAAVRRPQQRRNVGTRVRSLHELLGEGAERRPYPRLLVDISRSRSEAVLIGRIPSYSLLTKRDQQGSKPNLPRPASANESTPQQVKLHLRNLNRLSIKLEAELDHPGSGSRLPARSTGRPRQSHPRTVSSDRRIKERLQPTSTPLPPQRRDAAEQPQNQLLAASALANTMGKEVICANTHEDSLYTLVSLDSFAGLLTSSAATQDGGDQLVETRKHAHHAARRQMWNAAAVNSDPSNSRSFAIARFKSLGSEDEPLSSTYPMDAAAAAAHAATSPLPDAKSASILAMQAFSEAGLQRAEREPDIDREQIKEMASNSTAWTETSAHDLLDDSPRDDAMAGLLRLPTNWRAMWRNRASTSIFSLSSRPDTADT